MISIHQSRPFNTRYAIWAPAGSVADEQRTTHRTAKCNYWYITRQHGIDEVGPVPNFATRTDLVAHGRVGPARANDPALDGVKLWALMDEVSRATRPGEATLAHCVASLPIHESASTWRDMVEGFIEDHLASQGMVVDWAIHAQDEAPGQRRILPHAHLLVTTRVYDRSHPEFGKRRQAWLRTPGSAKALAEKWYAVSGIYPPTLNMPLALAA